MNLYGIIEEGRKLTQYNNNIINMHCRMNIAAVLACQSGGSALVIVYIMVNH